MTFWLEACAAKFPRFGRSIKKKIFNYYKTITKSKLIERYCVFTQPLGGSWLNCPWLYRPSLDKSVCFYSTIFPGCLADVSVLIVFLPPTIAAAP